MREPADRRLVTLKVRSMEATRPRRRSASICLKTGYRRQATLGREPFRLSI